MRKDWVSNLLRPLGFGCVLAMAGAPAGAASFDCATVKRPIDRLICASENTSSLDSRMADLYWRAIRQDSSTRTRDAQRAWIREVRDRCSDERCLIDVYQQRIAQLETGAASQQVSPGSSVDGPEVITAPLGTPRNAVERAVGAFTSCNTFDATTVCVATNSLHGMAPLQTRDADIPCIIDREVMFSFDPRARLSGVLCEAHALAWRKILSSMRRAAGKGEVRRMEIGGMVDDLVTWSTKSRVVTLSHKSGTNMKGAPIDSYVIHVATPK